MALRTWQLAFVLLAWVSVAPCARVAAQGPRIELSAELPESLQRCVSVEQLQTSLARESRRHQQQALELQVGLRVAGVEDGVTQLELTAATRAHALGTRVLPVRAADCAALPDTLALVLWLLSQSTEPAPPARPPPSAAKPAHDTELPPGQGPKPVAPSPRALELGLGAGAGAVFGVLPRAALALQLSAELRAAWLDFRVRAALLWPQRQTIAEGRVSMSFYELALEACPRWRVAQPLELRACAGPRLALLRSASTGFRVQNLPHTDVLVALGAAGEALLSLAERTQLVFDAGLALALERPHFALQFQNAQPQQSLAGPAFVRGEGSLSLVQMF